MTDLHEVLDAGKRIQTGNFFVSQNDFDTGLKLFHSALDAEPENLDALSNAAFLSLKQKQFTEAEDLIKQALRLDPENAHALGIYALIAQECGDPGNTHAYHMARVLFEHSLRNNPDSVTVLLNYAYFLQLTGDYPAALRTYTRARDLNPMDMSCRFQRAMCLMTVAETQEEWAEALGEYEIRHLIYDTRGPVTDKPLWVGQEFGCYGVLLIVCEQGVGDNLMMARYARWLKTNTWFCRIFILCKDFMVGLMNRVEAIDGAYSKLEDVPAFDFYIPSMSLLRATRYPAIKPDNGVYLRVARTRPGGRFRIGLCWSGNIFHGNDRWRSIPVELFHETFKDIPNTELFSLQRPDVAAPDFVNPARADSLESLADLIAGMDLVVTVDTAQLHLAGAMGIQTFTLLPGNCDWRWRVSGDRSDWYPSVRLFRAQAPLDWTPVLDSVRLGVIQYSKQHITS